MFALPAWRDTPERPAGCFALPRVPWTQPVRPPATGIGPGGRAQITTRALLSLSLSLSLSFLIMWNSVQAEVAYLSEVRSGVLRVLGFRVEGFLRLN